MPKCWAEYKNIYLLNHSYNNSLSGSKEIGIKYGKNFILYDVTKSKNGNNRSQKQHIY